MDNLQLIGNNVVQPEPTNKKTGSTIRSIIIGLSAGQAVKKVSSVAAKPAFKVMQKMSDGLTADEINIVNSGAEKIIKKTGLKEKGLQIVKLDTANYSKIKKLLNEYISKIKILNKFPQVSRDIACDMQLSNIMNGENAAFFANLNKILLPDKNKLGLSVFHEIGHAMNYNFGKLSNFLQKSRKLQLLAVPILIIGLFKNKKQEGEQPKNKVDKATDFVKENAGLLSALTMIPTILEEGLATQKGNKLASKVLSKDLLKKVKINNAGGMLTYIATAVVTGLSVHTAVKVKDKIVQNNIDKKNKQNNKTQNVK